MRRRSAVSPEIRRGKSQVLCQAIVQKGRWCFIRELVPKVAVAAVARIAFNENYSCVPMSHRYEVCGERGGVEAEYGWGLGPDRCLMRIETEESSFLPPEGSLSQFITEHYWGYAAQSRNGCLSTRSSTRDGLSKTQRGRSFPERLTGSTGRRSRRLWKRGPPISHSWPKGRP